MEQEGEPTWQPISALGLIAARIDAQLSGAQDQHRMLLAARPYVLDDATVERLPRAYGTPATTCGCTTSSSTGGTPRP